MTSEDFKGLIRCRLSGRLSLIVGSDVIQRQAAKHRIDAKSYIREYGGKQTKHDTNACANERRSDLPLYANNIVVIPLHYLDSKESRDTEDRCQDGAADCGTEQNNVGY